MMRLEQIDRDQARAILVAMRGIVDHLDANPTGTGSLWVYPSEVQATVNVGPRVPQILITQEIECKHGAGQ